MRSGLKSQIVGFAWSSMQLILAELNSRAITRHLWYRFRVIKKPFNFLTMLSPTMNAVSFELDGVPLTVLSVLFSLMLLFSLLLLYYYYY